MATAVYAAPLVSPKFRGFTAAGAPLTGGLVNVYLAGTTTRTNSYPTYADGVAGTNANANPVVLDANGEAPIFLPILSTGGLYKIVLTDSTGSGGYTIDSINPAGQFFDPRSALSVVKSGADQTGFATATKVATWTSETDALSEWVAGTNRWVATYAGRYRVSMSAMISDTSASQDVTLSIYKTGATAAASRNRTTATASQITTAHVTHVLNLIAGDYIEMFVTGTVNTTVTQGTGTQISITRI